MRGGLGEQGPDLLHADDLLARLGQTKIVGRAIRVFEEVLGGSPGLSDIEEEIRRLKGAS